MGSFTDDAPIGDPLGWCRYFDVAAVDLSHGALPPLDERSRERHGGCDQKQQRQDCEHTRRERTPSSEPGPQAMEERVDGDGDDYAPEDRGDEGCDDLARPEGEDRDRADSNRGLNASTDYGFRSLTVFYFRDTHCNPSSAPVECHAGDSTSAGSGLIR